MSYVFIFFIVFYSFFIHFLFKKFLREELKEQFNQFIIKSVRIPPLDKEGTLNVQRPSILLRQIGIFRSVLQMIGNYTLLNVSKIIEEVLCNLTHHPVFENKEDPLNWLREDKIFLSEEKYPLLIPYIRLYTDFVLQRMEYGSLNFSPSHDCYVSKSFKAEDYCSRNEFESLAALIGVKGIQLIDRNLLKNISGKFLEMKVCLFVFYYYYFLKRFETYQFHQENSSIFLPFSCMNEI